MLGVLLATVHYETAWSAVVPSGAPVGATIGDQIVVRPFSRANVTVLSGIFTAGSGRATPDRPFKFHCTGDDGYFIKIEGNRAAAVELDRAVPNVPPIVIGLLFGAAFLLIVFATARVLPGGRGAPKADGRIVAGIWAASAALMYVLTPHEYHNDTIGGDEWRNWGYLGFGYLDTMRAVAVAAVQHGVAGLVDVDSMGKPVAYQAIAAILGGAWLPAFMPVVISCAAMGAAVAGTYVLGRQLGGEIVGLIAAGTFTVSPVVLQYAGAFYQESGYLAAACWALALTARAVKTGSGRSLAWAAVLAAIAVSSKQILTAPLLGVGTILISVAVGSPWRRAIAIGALQTAAALAGFIALWPFLWKDMSYRLAFIWGQRIAFDAIVGISHPIGQRFVTSIAQGLGHCGPAMLVLISLGVWSGIKHHKTPALLCAVGVLIGLAYVVPTSLYLQHYILFAYPFVPLLAGFGFDALRLSRYMQLRAGIAAVALDLAWSAWFLPYPGAAAIGCGDFACTANRYGPAEPTYGLRSAAQWLHDHTQPGDGVDDLTSPHVLQAYLPDRAVLTLYLPPTRKKQEEALQRARARYVVTNAYSDAAGERVLTPELQLVWTGNPREGSPRIYAASFPGSARTGAPAGAEPTPQAAAALLPPETTRVIVTGHRDQFAAAFGERQTALPPATASGESFDDVIGLGGGIAVVDDRSTWAATLAALEAPAALDGSNVAYVLPTIQSYRMLSPMKLVTSDRRGYAELRAAIPFDASTAPFDDAVQVDVALAHPIAATGHARVNVSCVFGHAVDADVIWLGPSRFRALASVRGDLLDRCLQYHSTLTIVADIWMSSAKHAALPEVRSASAGLAWNAASAGVLAGSGRPLAVVGYGPPNGMKMLWSGADVVAFLRAAPETALVMATSDRRFRTFFDRTISLTASTDLLEFSRQHVPVQLKVSDY